MHAQRLSSVQNRRTIRVGMHKCRTNRAGVPKRHISRSSVPKRRSARAGVLKRRTNRAVYLANHITDNLGQLFLNSRVNPC